MWQNHRFFRSNYQDDPKTPEVTGFVVSCTLKKFRCCVLQREAGSLQGGAACRAQAGKSKIYYFQHRFLPLVCKQHVLDGKQIKSVIILLLFLTFYTQGSIFPTEQRLINTTNKYYYYYILQVGMFLTLICALPVCTAFLCPAQHMWCKGGSRGQTDGSFIQMRHRKISCWYLVKIRLDAGGQELFAHHSSDSDSSFRFKKRKLSIII